MFEQIRNYYTSLVPGISGEDWSKIESRFTVQNLKKGEMLTRAGEVSRTVSFVNKGILRIFYTVQGQEISTGFVQEGEYISCYASFLTREPAAESIDALEDAELINLSYDDMQELYQSNPVFERFGRKVAEMLFRMVSTQTTRLLTLNPEERYKSIIESQPFIINRVPQYMIASYIGITPEHLSRLRKKMTGR